MQNLVLLFLTFKMKWNEIDVLIFYQIGMQNILIKRSIQLHFNDLNKVLPKNQIKFQK